MNYKIKNQSYILNKNHNTTKIITHYSILLKISKKKKSSQVMLNLGKNFNM